MKSGRNSRCRLFSRFWLPMEEFPVPGWPPDEVSIQRVVTGYIETWKPIGVSNIQIVFKMFRKID